LDAIASDAGIERVFLLDPDVYQKHNIARHRFDPTGIGQLKVDLAMASFRARFPQLVLDARPWDLCDPGHQTEIAAMVEQCDIGICAADNETAKFHFDALMRQYQKPWTMGEVLSGGIGGFVHRFVPGGPCYGCVASYLQRNVTESPPGKAPDYSAPGGPIEEARIPASKAAIETIAGLHALITLDLLEHPLADVDITSLLFSLKKVDGVFTEAFRAHRLVVPRLPKCLICGAQAMSTENLDVALDQAFARLGDSGAGQSGSAS
jgi:molybdopterin/thiamine biosynthesis adenylyltransferase